MILSGFVCLILFNQIQRIFPDLKLTAWVGLKMLKFTFLPTSLLMTYIIIHIKHSLTRSNVPFTYKHLAYCSLNHSKH